MKLPLLVLISAAAFLLASDMSKPLNLKLRSRVEAFKGSNRWEEVGFQQSIQPKETAIVICDMWDKHWCRGASERVGQLVLKMNPVLEVARKRGVTIVHAPSETMQFYVDHPARKSILEFPAVATPTPLALTEPKLPIDDSDGGCDTDDKSYKAWKRQHAGLHIDDNDFISDKGAEIYNMFRARGIKTMLVMGVHTNMCILNRSFAIRQMTRWGIPCILVRDLTDAMYDPKDVPHVSHARGTELVVQHIESFWAPTVTSQDLLQALR
jgi:nicotinamidase-related amidase